MHPELLPAAAAGRRRAWTRPKRFGSLFAVGACGLLVLLALVLLPQHRRTVPSALDESYAKSQDAVTGAAVTVATLSEADQLAAAALPRVSQDASRPAPLSRAQPPDPILLPVAALMGPAGVLTGFPRTPEGALAQLAAIDATALSSVSLPAVREVITRWALPGGPTASSWSGVQATAVLLDTASATPSGSGQLVVVATALMGLVKGALPSSTAPDLVLACVDLELDVTILQTARGATADCQRMAWVGDRWMIGPGAEPAGGPSVWPGTDLAYRVGWRDLRPAAAAAVRAGATPQAAPLATPPADWTQLGAPRG